MFIVSLRLWDQNWRQTVCYYWYNTLPWVPWYNNKHKNLCLLFLWDSGIKTDDKLCVIISIIHFHEFPDIQKLVFKTLGRTETCVLCLLFLWDCGIKTDNNLCVIISIIHFHEFHIQQQGQKLVFISGIKTHKLCVKDKNLCLLFLWDCGIKTDDKLCVIISIIHFHEFPIQQQGQKLVFIVSLSLLNQNRRQTVCYYWYNTLPWVPKNRYNNKDKNLCLLFLW